MQLSITQKTGLILGPLFFVLILLFFKPEGLDPKAISVLACTAWIATWWITEAIPIAATALLPIVLFPLTGSLSLSETTANFGHKYIFLFLGGFILAMAIEKWNLHKRIALKIIWKTGTNVSRIILGFMLATAFLSMWISNTATAVMILPVGVAIVTQIKENEQAKVGKALMLAIAYSASIGGMATLIGTPPNLVLAGVVEESYHTEITFFQWFSFGFPVCLVLLLVAWVYLTKIAFRFSKGNLAEGKEEIKNQLKALGITSYEEKAILWVFTLTALAWICRSFLLAQFLPSLDDTIIAIVAALVLFLIPSKKTPGALISWQDARKLPWGILLLFGGGMALAVGFESSGLAVWIASQLSLVEGLPSILLVLIIIASVNFLTEITSNLATTAMLLPVLVSMASVMDIHPYVLLVGATVAASCAFMLPVATPPNAIVFGSRYLEIGDMVKKGFWMNLTSIAVLTLFVNYILPFIWSL